MEVVRNKIRDHPTLKQLNDKRVLDKIRSEWRNSDLADEEAAGTCNMPTQLGFLSRQKLFPIKWAASLKLVMRTIHAAHQTLLGRQIQAILADVFSVMETKSSFCGCVVLW